MKNQLGVYYAFLATSDDVDWLQCIARTKAAGLTVLEVSAPKLRLASVEARHAIAQTAKDAGVALTFATALTPEADVSSPSPAIRAAGIRLLKNDLQMVREMGGNTLGGVVTNAGKHFPPDNEHTRDAAMERAAVSLREVAKAGEALGINIGVEVVNRFESALVNTCEEGLMVVQAVGSPRLGIHLDTFHMNIEEADIGAAICLAGKRLIHFHACANNRALPGAGHIDWIEVCTALNAVDYQGPIVMEALPGPYGSVAGRLNIWRQLSRNVDAELAQATCFLRERMVESFEC